MGQFVRSLSITKLVLTILLLAYFLYKYSLFETVYQRRFAASAAIEMTVFFLTGLFALKYWRNTKRIAAVLFVELAVYLSFMLAPVRVGINYLSMFLVFLTMVMLLVSRFGKRA